VAAAIERGRRTSCGTAPNKIMPYFYGYRSLEYQKHCAIRPITSSVVAGSLFTGIAVVAQGAPLSPRLVAINIGGIYAYNVLQCPMEALHNRVSAWHNAVAGATLGFVGVTNRVLGVPFVDASFFYRYPQVSPPLAGAAVYGGIGFLLATLGGKPA